MFNHLRKQHRSLLDKSSEDESRTLGDVRRPRTLCRVSPFRYGRCVLAIVGVMLAFSSSAWAANIGGAGSGTSVQQADGTFTMIGTWTDATTGIQGTYRGSYAAFPPANFSSCRLSFYPCPTGPPFNSFPPELNPAGCNLVAGTLTFSSPGQLDITLWISFNFGSPMADREQSSICQQTAGSPQHDLRFWLVPDYPELLGWMFGTSTPLGSGLYQDSFSLGIGPSRNTVPPTCTLTDAGTTSSGNNFIEVSITSETGIHSINVSSTTNATVKVPPFAANVYGPVVVTTTAINAFSPADVEFRVNDAVYNETTCSFTIPANAFEKPPKQPKPPKPPKPPKLAKP